MGMIVIPHIFLFIPCGGRMPFLFIPCCGPMPLPHAITVIENVRDHDRRKYLNLSRENEKLIVSKNGLVVGKISKTVYAIRNPMKYNIVQQLIPSCDMIKII